MTTMREGESETTMQTDSELQAAIAEYDDYCERSTAAFASGDQMQIIPIILERHDSMIFHLNLAPVIGALACQGKVRVIDTNERHLLVEGVRKARYAGLSGR